MTPDSNRWDQILAAPRAPDDGSWTALPRIPRSALVAFVAGPGNARGAPLDRATPTVRVTREVDGHVIERYTRPLQDEDVADEMRFLASYLADLGLPAPRDVYEWRVRTPTGRTSREVLAIVEDAAAAPPITDDPAADALASARSVAEAAARLWGVRNPLE